MIDWTTPSKRLALAALAALAALLLTAPTALGAFQLKPGLQGFDGSTTLQNGDPATQAGSHPFSAQTSFFFTTISTPGGREWPSGTLKNSVVELPPGFVANPQSYPTCTDAQLVGVTGAQPECSPSSQVGVLLVRNGGGPVGFTINQLGALYNMERPDGTPAVLGANIASNLVHLVAHIRNGSDYGATVINQNASQTVNITGITVVAWGTPAAPVFDSQRKPEPGPSAAPLKPFVTLPTSCVGPVETRLHVDTWEGEEANASFLSHDNTTPTPNPIGNTGCASLEFTPSLAARPTTNVADSASGLDVNLHIPQSSFDNPNTTVQANLRDTTVVLPEGLTVNPSAANGLGACSPSQVGLTSAVGVSPITYTEDEAQCPDAAKVGSAEVTSPLVDHPIQGGVYLATPHDNPFGSLLALYLVANDPEIGLKLKLAGEVTPDPVTGQLTATFEENPQLPFEDLDLRFFGGAGGALRTPATCGTYTTNSTLTPWSAPDSGPPTSLTDAWAIERGPGGNCASSAAQLPNSASFDAGTVSPIAGAKTPLVVNLRREDGTQQFFSLTLSPPQGLVGKLAGIPYCSEDALAAAAAKSGRAEEASSSCPQASYVGSVTASAGAGPAPYNAPGKAYLTGPYKGAPLSLAIVTPATAGPFDLGTIVVRTALYVDSKTTQITAVSDPIPSILQGIPLDVRSVQVKMDRPDFTLNPSSCDPSTFGGQLMSTLGQTAPLQSRFQVGECGRLGFKPKLTLALKGGTKRTGHPALTATLQMPDGNANLAAISVALPHSEFLDQSHIGTVCTRVQFAADQCPAASVYGTATVTTPLLDYPLTGNVHLRSSSNPLPDLVPDLRGPAIQPIKLESAGRVDSVNGGIRNTFEFIPDAPFTKLTLQMQGGKKGLLENSTNLCQKVQKATVKYTAHNGATLEAHPVLKAECKGKKKKPKKSKRVAKRHGRSVTR
jgi:hypothetical protein